MSDLNAAIYNILENTADLTALVATRIRPDVLDQNETMPAVVFWRVSGRTENEINGSVSGLARSRITIESYSDTRKQSNLIAEYIRIGLINARGTYAGTQIRNCLIDTHQQHFTEQPTDGNGQFRYVTSQDFTVNYIEDV